MIVIIMIIKKILMLLLLIIIKDAWTNFDSQIYYTLYEENDLKQITKERRGKCKEK